MSETQISIAELFAKDPLEHSSSDLSAIVEHYRKNRHVFNSGMAGATSSKTRAKQEAAEKKIKELGLDLGDIEI